MNRALLLAALAAFLEAGAAPPPPITSAWQASPSALRLASFAAGPVRCGAAENIPIRAVAPLPVASAVAGTVEAIRFAFRIDRNGRPLSIHRIGAAADPALDNRDLAPALAGWRFEPGAEQADCEIAFNVRLDRIEAADDALLYRYAALGRMQIPGSVGGALIRQAFDRLRPPGATCLADPIPIQPINLHYGSIPEIPGGMSYSFFSYDVDAQGRPVHIRLLSSSGNRLLDMEGDIAIGRARFAPRPIAGCLYYFYRANMERVPAPEESPVDFHPSDAVCTGDVPRRIISLFHMQFPAEFMRRHAEGWVVFRYDVATSGALDNVRILVSEPAARFGEEVSRAAASVRVNGVSNPQRGCVQRVHFRLPTP